MMMRRAARLVAVLLAVGTLAACGSGDSGAEPSPSPSSAVLDVPGAKATVTVPPQWSHTSQGASPNTELVVTSPTATGSPAFQPNVVVTSKKATQSLDDEGTAARAAADALPGWTPADGGGPTQVAGLPALVIVGRYHGSGIDVTQTETIVELTQGKDRTFVYLTTSVAPAAKDASTAEAKRQADSAAQAQSIVDSLAPRS